MQDREGIMKLRDKVAIITGAGSGIGRAIGILFAREGARVVIADVDDRSGKETVSQITTNGGKAIFSHTDITKSYEVERLIKMTTQTYGKLDILCNIAGVSQIRKPVETIQETEWDHIYAVNAKGVFLGVKYAVPEMKMNGGAIINVASAVAVRVRPNIAAYASSKGAVVVLTKELALELAPYKIRVNCINPGPTETPLLRSMASEEDREEDEKQLLSIMPFGRLLKPEEIAHAALFLASDESSNVTGISLDVDGGRCL